MAREIIRVEPLSSWLERWKAPTSAVTRHGDTIYVSGFPPFDPQTGEVLDAPIDQQTERVLEQLQLIAVVPRARKLMLVENTEFHDFALRAWA